ncbi:MAG: DNA replication/repair protein RecF, partial [Deltaproteobacteria bacterium]|nr:DNA replication/repair protein RecF [Deltaproteobacteria bacterium]
MFIENIKLVNFRNIKYTELTPHNKINFIMGSNAQGKTNFIEAIYLAAFLKSFRTQKNSDLIKEGEKELLVELNINKYFVKNSIKLSISKDKKIISVDNKKINNNKNYFKNINVIIFHPDEVNYIGSYPVFRRNLIDRS